MATDSRRKRWPKVLLVIAILVAVIAVMFYVDHQAAKNRVLVTISKETTYITEPLRPDGYPDYVGALNQRLSKGVTPENNSAVLFWQAVGPSEIMAEQRERFFQMLGISPLPEKGDYFVTSSNCEDAYVAQQKSKGQPVGDKSDYALSEPIRNQFTSAMKRPWSPQEFPVWAKWIAANEKPLAMLVEATKRPRRYDPMISDTVICILLPGAQHSRDVARALVSRDLSSREGPTWASRLKSPRWMRLPKPVQPSSQRTPWKNQAWRQPRQAVTMMTSPPQTWVG